MHPITFYDWSLGTRSQVPCASNALNSLLIASCHFGDFIASETHVGSMVDGRGCLVVKRKLLLGLWILCMDRVAGLKRASVDARSSSGE